MTVGKVDFGARTEDDEGLAPLLAAALDCEAESIDQKLESLAARELRERGEMQAAYSVRGRG